MSVHHTSDDASESRLLAIKTSIRNNDQCTIKHILTEGFDVRTVISNLSKATMAQWMIFYNQFEMLQMFITMGCELNTRDQDGDTPLHEAAYRNHLIALKYLMEGGADPTIENDKGETPLDIAMSENNTSIVEYLKAAEFPVSLSHFCCWWLAANDRERSRKRKEEAKAIAET
jgi:ankyrin repeat protein